MSESGHGSDVRSLRTQARYDVEAGEFVEYGVGQHLTRPQVPGAAEVVLDRLDADAGRVEGLAGLGDDLGADAVPGEDADLVGHMLSLRNEKPPT